MPTPEDVIRKEESQGLLFDLERGPLWRVGIYNNATAAGGCYVALTVSHILMDGSGAVELLKVLLDNPGIDPISKPAVTSPPRAEDTMNMSPTYIEAASAIGQEIFVNSLPSFLQGLLRKDPFWPTSEVLGKRPIECTSRRYQVDFGNSRPLITSGLKSFGKLSGAGSIQSLIHTACLIAHLSASAGTQYQEVPPGRLDTETPIALRSAELGHPPLLGNYTALANFSANIQEVKRQTILQVTSEYNAIIHSTEGREAAKRRAGMLGWIPDLPYLSTPSFTLDGSKVTPCPTGFESFLAQQGTSALPYRGSFAVSNLGLLDLSRREDSGLEKLWFVQSPMPWGVALYVDVVGFSTQYSDDAEIHTELGITVSWLEGAIDAELAERFGRALSTTIENIALAGNAGLEAVVLLKNRTLQDLEVH